MPEEEKKEIFPIITALKIPELVDEELFLVEFPDGRRVVRTKAELERMKIKTEGEKK